MTGYWTCELFLVFKDQDADEVHKQENEVNIQPFLKHVPNKLRNPIFLQGMAHSQKFHLVCPRVC